MPRPEIGSTESLTISLKHIHPELELSLIPMSGDSLFDLGVDAADYGEARFQLQEGCFYEYEFNSDEFSFGSFGENIIQPLKSHPHLGIISPNIFVGTMNLPIRRRLDGAEIDRLQLEVRSKKTGYRDDYRTMLEFITERCVDLILQSESVVFQNLTSDYSKAAANVLYQRFMFVKSVVSSEEFEGAVQRVLTAPVTRWANKVERRDIRHAGRYSRSNIDEILKGSNRVPVPEGHPVRAVGLKTIPDHISGMSKSDTVDTPENRFIKHALEGLLRFCEDVHEALPDKSGSLGAESRVLMDKLESWLQHDVFKSQSKTTLLKLNSPILQRKAGYREVLKFWLMFDIAAKLIWTGGDDVYSAGKKDVATLYEYWLFFLLLDLLKSMYKIEAKDLDRLVQPSKDGMTLSLKQGNFIALNGVSERNGRKLNVRFSYNRQFTGKSSYPKSGSWTSSLRPDYTLSIWPYGINESQAETEELIVHVHFDAKYKVDIDYRALIESDADVALDDKLQNRRGIVKNADLLKMHAYKDAIRRTGGAYVLYPGNQEVVRSGFHEIVPGLGAFPIKPSKDDSGIDAIRVFLERLTEHFIDRTTQREKLAYRTYNIFKSPPQNDHRINEPVPEAYGPNRGLIPDETYVLVGYFRDDAHRNWIRKKGLYNCRAGAVQGSLVLDPKTVGARFLLLHTKGDATSGDLLRIDGDGPRILSAEDMIKEEYPNSNPHAHYLIWSVSQVIESELAGKSWSLRGLAGYKRGRATASPFVVSLAELMKCIA